MTLTKEQAGKLIDRLADKSLTRGCFVEMDLFGIKEVLATSKCHDTPLCISYGECNENDWFRIHHQDTKGIKRILGHPIMIGDVLEKIEKAKFTTKDLERIFPKALSDSQKKKGVTLHHDNLYIEINHLWRNCGFTKSLQEIFEMIEWEEEVAKPSPATELFQFLASLFTP